MTAFRVFRIIEAETGSDRNPATLGTVLVEMDEGYRVDLFAAKSVAVEGERIRLAAWSSPQELAP